MFKFLIAAALSLAVLGSTSTAWAETKAPDPTVQAEQRSTLQTATAMINYGRAKSDPLALLAAVQMMVSVQSRIEDKAGQPMNLGAVLDEAVAMADGDALILARADALRDDVETEYRDACYWEYYCDWYGYCEYWWVCF